MQSLVNTRALLPGQPYAREDLDSPATLDRWWGQYCNHHPPATAADLAATLVAREGLRGLLARNNDCAGGVEHEAIARLDTLGASLPLRFTAGADGTALVPVDTTSMRAALAALLAAVVRAQDEGSWSRLKACRDPDCREAFYDGSRNRSRTWCSMEVCGARAKQRTFADRHRRPLTGPG